MQRGGHFGSVIIGAPGAFTVWVFELVKALAAQEPTRAIRHIDRRDSIAGELTPYPIYITQFPGDAIIEAIERDELDVLIALEDPIDAVAFMRRNSGVSLIEAIRAQTASSVAHLAIGQATHANILHRETDRPAREVALHVARFLSLPADDAVLDRFAGTGAKGRRLSVEAALEAHVTGYAKPLRGQGRSTEVGAQIIADVLDPVIEMARGDVVRPIVWPTEVFLSGDRPNEPAPLVATISGPARILFYGPYFHLPPADYRVEVILTFSGHTEIIPFMLEVHAGAPLARIRIDQRTRDDYRGFFTLHHRSPVEALEIRLSNEQGAIEGEIALVEVRFFVLNR